MTKDYFHRRIKLKDYGTYVDVVIGNTEDNILFSKKKYKKTKPEDLNDIAKFIRDNSGGCFDLEETHGAKAWFIFINIDACEDRLLGTLVHELHHAFRSVDRHYQINSEEFVSYLLGNNTHLIFNEYEKEKQKCLKSE